VVVWAKERPAKARLKTESVAESIVKDAIKVWSVA
jgi:hypothetical protein